VAEKFHGKDSPEVIGLDVNEIAVPFKRPDPSMLRMLPVWIVHYAGNLFTVRPAIDWENAPPVERVINLSCVIAAGNYARQKL
jgi:hypothetical protein